MEKVIDDAEVFRRQIQHFMRHGGDMDSLSDIIGSSLVCPDCGEKLEATAGGVYRCPKCPNQAFNNPVTWAKARLRK